MEAQQLQRLNTLAEKAKTDTATPNELKELKQLRMLGTYQHA